MFLFTNPTAALLAKIRRHVSVQLINLTSAVASEKSRDAKSGNELQDVR